MEVSSQITNCELLLLSQVTQKEQRRTKIMNLNNSLNDKHKIKFEKEFTGYK